MRRSEPVMAQLPEVGPISRSLRLLVTFLVVGTLLLPIELLLARVKGAGEARRDSIAGDFIPVRLKPHFSGRVGGLRFTTNDYGFRGDEQFPVNSPPGERRVLALGDSVGFGWGIELIQHYSKVLEQRLNQDDSGTWRVINAAGQGYSPSSYHAYLREEGLQFEPDLVLIQVEFTNDVTDEALLCWRGRDRFQGPLKVSGGRYTVAWDGNLLGTVGWGWQHEHTYLYALTMRRLLTTWWEWWPRGPLAQQPPPPYFHLGFDRPLLGAGALEAGWTRLLDSLSAIQRLLQDREVPLLVLLLPSRYVFEDDSRISTLQARRFLERGQEAARSQGIAWLSCVDSLERAGGAERYLDFAHPDTLGNLAIGQELAAYIQAVYQ